MRPARLLWLLQAGGNLLLLWLVFEWLGIRDARAWQIALTALLGIAILFLALWLHGSTFAYYGAGQPRGLVPVFRGTLRTWLAFGAVVVLFVVLWMALDALADPFESASQWTASLLTFRLRKPVNPMTVGLIYGSVLRGLQWVVLPAVLLPVAARAATAGWSGFSWAASRRAWRRRYWLEFLVAAFVGFYLPWKLIHWVPGVKGAAWEVVSFAARFAVAYVLCVTGWMALAFFSAGEKA